LFEDAKLNQKRREKLCWEGHAEVTDGINHGHRHFIPPFLAATFLAPAYYTHHISFEMHEDCNKLIELLGELTFAD